MSAFNTVLNGIHSSEQKIDFYNESFNGMRSVGLSFKSMNLPMVPSGRFSLCDFKTEMYEVVNRRQINLNGYRFNEFVEFKVLPRVERVNLNGVKSKVQLISIGEKKYIVVGSQSYPLFDPSTVIVKVSKIRLKPSLLRNANSDHNYRYTLTKSHYHGIFNGAINAKRVMLKTQFSIYIPSSKKILIERHLYETILSPYTRWRKMIDAYNGIIVFFSLPYGGLSKLEVGKIDTKPVENFIQPPQESRNLNGVRSGKFSIERKRTLNGMRSVPIPFHTKLKNFNGVKHIMTMKMFNTSFNGVQSNVFNVLRVRSHSSSSVFKNLNGVRYDLFSVKTRVYARNELIDVPGSRYFFAKHVGLKTFPAVKHHLCRFRIPLTQERDLYGVRSNPSPMQVVIEARETQDFNGVKSNWMNLIAGDKELINKDGLYKDMFIDSTREVTHFRTPWTPKESDMVRVGKGIFNGISFVRDTNVFKIKKESKQTFLLNWKMVVLSKEHWLIPRFELAPYIKAETEDRSDFIILSVSPTGGSIVHMHKKGFKESFSFNGGYKQQEFIEYDKEGEKVELKSIDSSLAEDAAIVVASARYKRYAQILHDTDNGISWDAPYIDEAVKYMDENRDKTFFFYDAPYSPTVLSSIIQNKSKGLLNKNIFHAPEIMCYNSQIQTIHEIEEGQLTCSDNTLYIHEIEDEIPESGMVYSFVTEHRDIRLKKSAAKIAMVFGNSTMSKSIGQPFIDNCSTGSLCSKVNMSIKSSYNQIILRPIDPKHIASWATNRGMYDYAVEKNIDVIATGSNVTIPAFRSVKFVNLKTNKRLLGVRSNEMSLVTTIGTFLNGIRHTDRFTTGLTIRGGVKSKKLDFKINTFSTNIDGIRSEFRIKLHFNLRRDQFDGVKSKNIPLSLNAGIVGWNGVSNNREETIWLKMFPQHYAGKSEIEAPIMKFYITDREFDKSMFFPFDYADPDAKPAGRPSKSGSPDYIEKKIVEIPDILGPTSVSPTTLNQLCGDYRSTTLLEYEGFDHIFREGDNQIFGHMTWEDRKFIMSAYLRIRENSVIKKGVKLSEADILRRTLAEVRLSAIEDLSVVEDWHIEDFKLEAKDFGLTASNAERLSSIDDAFRIAMKSVLETIGDEASTAERHKGEDQFPAFPERRVIGDELSKTLKPRQYFIVEEVKK